MTHAPSPANYEYIHLKLVQRYGDTLPSLRILDFGCGQGGLVEYLRDKGLNAVGADPYQGIYQDWQHKNEYISKIENRVLPFDSDSFDCVVSNQVFEHIKDYHQELQEVKRVLKKDGYFLALFPVLETAYEVHTGIWFAYYFKFCPPLLQAWLYLWRSLGCGLWKRDLSIKDWSIWKRNIIINDCHYKCVLQVQRDWKNMFGYKPKTHMADYLRFRFGKTTRLKSLANYHAPIMTLLSMVRGGIVIDTHK